MFSLMTFNILLMSISFALIFTGFNTSMLVQVCLGHHIRVLKHKSIIQYSINTERLKYILEFEYKINK